MQKPAQKRPEYKGNVWWLFRIQGLEITGKQSHKENLLFGDSTIISPSYLKTKIEEVFTIEDEQHIENMENMKMLLLGPKFTEKYDSILIVKRKGSGSLASAEKRASYLGSLLTINSLLDINKKRGICGLVKHIENFENSAHQACFCFEDKYWQMSIGPRHYSQFKFTPAAKMSIKEITRKLNRKLTKPLTTIISSTRSLLTKSLERSIKEAAFALAKAAQTDLPNTQHLNSIISLEILLTANNANFTDIESRVIALLGTGIEDKYGLREILDGRHKLVHQGVDVTAYVARQGIGLALNVILKYSELALTFKDKYKLLNYLDLITKAETNGTGTVRKIIKKDHKRTNPFNGFMK